MTPLLSWRWKVAVPIQEYPALGTLGLLLCLLLVPLLQYRSWEQAGAERGREALRNADVTWDDATSALAAGDIGGARPMMESAGSAYLVSIERLGNRSPMVAICS